MLKKNILANFFGRVWPSVLGIITVPIFLRYLSIEAYGLVGFFLSLQAIISFLDLGLSTTTNREVSIGLTVPENRQRTHDLIYTFEAIYALISIVIVLVSIFISNWLANEWINAKDLSVDIIQFAVVVFGSTLALRWPIALYTGVLQGSESQVLNNLLSIVLSTFRVGGALVFVAFVSHTIIAYLFWQFTFAFIEIIVMRNAAWKVLNKNGILKPHWNFSLLSYVWRFSASISINSMLAALLKQMDRFLISNLLLLQQVGYYTTANVVYTALSMMAFPFSAAAFPRFTSLIATKNDALLAETYHKLSQSVSFFVTPLTSIIFFFSYEILLIWTRSPDVAANAAPTLSILALAAMFNSMMHIPFVLQLAAGITRIALLNNAVNLIVLMPIMYYLISHFGIAGAGIAWAVFNVFYYLIVPQVMHLYLLPNEKWTWIFYDTFPFMVMCVLIYGGVYLLSEIIEKQFLMIILLMGSALYTSLCMLIYPFIRALVMDLFINNLVIRKFVRIRK